MRPPLAPPRRPQNGTQAHDMSRELKFVRPAHIGATPFWDRRSAPSATANRAPSGTEKKKDWSERKCEP